MKSAVTGLLILVSFQYLSWDEYLKKEILAKSDLSIMFPNTEHLEKWQISSDVVVDPKSPRPVDIEYTSHLCEKDKNLYPAHPQQDTKEYLYGAYANYAHHKLPVDSSACVTVNPTRRFCLRATYANLIIMSDIYEDACGNYYRGYWLTSFLKSDESMGTLFSKGKTAYEKPEAEFPGEFVMGPTYAVDKINFLFLGKLRPNDKEAIERGRKEATQLGFRREGLIFTNSRH